MYLVKFQNKPRIQCTLCICIVSVFNARVYNYVCRWLMAERLFYQIPSVELRSTCMVWQ